VGSPEQPPSSSHAVVAHVHADRPSTREG
jgi:hypothetical protein